MSKNKKSNNTAKKFTLFAGDFKRDSVITDMEKAAEASHAFWNWISENVDKIKEKISKSGK